MSDQKIAKLLSMQENEILDFKATQYDFGGTTKEERDKKRGVFVKDILCMANTLREEDAHIILGVKSYPDGTKDFNGISEHVDDADLQTKIEGWVYPHPRFKYEPILYEGKTLGLITISLDKTIGPYYFIKQDLGKFLQSKTLYFRKGTKNSIASQEEQKSVYAWFIDTGKIRSFDLDRPATSPWEELLNATCFFDQRRSFILALPHFPSNIISNDELSALAGIDWFFVADFDSNSMECGVFKSNKAIIEEHRSVHLLTKGDKVNFNPKNSIYWYFIRGLEGRDDTLSKGTWMEWKKFYYKDLNDKAEDLIRVIPRPITIFVIWYSQDLIRHLNTLLETLVPPISEEVDIVVATDDESFFINFEEDYNAKIIEIPVKHLISGIRDHAADKLNRPSDAIILPSKSGANIEVDSKIVKWIEEEFEIVHINLGKRPPEAMDSLNQFLRGKPISWFELALHVDVERDMQLSLENKVRGLLQSRRSVRINLYHEPGSGGSTAGRRVVWNLRRDYPCVILNRCYPKQTVEKIQRIFSITGSSVLILTEATNISDQQSDEFASLLSARNIPSVMLQIIRRFEKPEKLSENSFYMSSVLSEGELYRFETILCKEAPEKTLIINKAITSQNEVEKTPFYLGLTAFEEEFISLNKYVLRHLERLNERQRKTLLYFSIGLFYGQRPLDLQMFAALFGIPPKKSVDIEKIFDEYSLRLLVKLDSFDWRPVHQLIAQEVIVQSLSHDLTDARLWAINLCDTSIEFAEFCAACDGENWDKITDTLQRVFFYRDESVILGGGSAGSKLFSRIIAHIPNDEARLRVFLRLTELFPDDHHYWAHLGRFYSNQMDDHVKGIKAIERALAIENQDHVIHHMKGMVYRNWAKSEIGKGAELSAIIHYGKLASECFASARELAPDDDYGYISEIQLIIRILDYGAKIRNESATSIAALSSDDWLRESLDNAEGLLEEVRLRRQNETESEYEGKCRADLDVLYGQHSQALQTWQNLLDRQTVYAPPIRRQIIRTLLVRNQRRWEQMPQKEIKRSLMLIDKNIAEEPGDGRNMGIWLQALRASVDEISIENVIEKIAYWASISDSLDANYYLYILYSLCAIEGSSIAVSRAESFLEKCRVKSKYRRDRTKSHEWLGLKAGLKGLVHKWALGAWDRDNNFWKNKTLLKRQEGIITKIAGPEAGVITVCGLKAFFVPGVSGHAYGEAENRKVSFFLGFSYDGIRAWSVENFND